MAVASLFPAIKPSLNLDFANTKSLDPRITFSRASAATYYDGKTVAKAEENLLLSSQDFDAGSWLKNSSAISANAGVGPDGTVTADLLYPTASATNAGLYQSFTSQYLNTATPKVFSIYAKASGINFLGLMDASTGSFRTWFDLSTGTVGTVPSNHTASIVAVGGGWYRCIVSTSVAWPGNSIVNWFICDSNGSSAVTANGSSGVLIWGAQLEQRSQVTAYTPTMTQPITNYIPVLQTAQAGVPRFDHNSVTGESLGLLVEEQRTNLLNGSEDFTSGYWTVDAGLSVVPSQILAPDGKQTATLLKEDGASSARRLRRNMQQSAAGDYTVTVYVKFAGRRRFRLIELSQIGGNVEFDVVAGAVVATSAPARNGTITPVGNGWYRCSATWAFLASTPTNVFINILDDSGTQVYQGNNYSGIYIWGAQLEAGTFPTSYIKTEASQVTRAADSASMVGANFSSWYRQDEGTLCAEFKVPSTSSCVAGIGADTFQSNLTFNNQQLVRFSAASPTLTLGAAVEGSNKLSAVIKNGDYAATANGQSLSKSSVILALPPAVTLRIGGAYAGGTTANGTIKRLTYYPKRLTDTQLQALTA